MSIIIAILLLFSVLSTSSWNGYNDELVWGAAWLYKATGDEAYLNKAKQYYQNFNLAGQDGVFSWDDKNVGVHALMAELTGDAIYKNSLQGFCDKAVSSQTRSPNGMLFYYQWGSLRYASNAAFICLKVNWLFRNRHISFNNLYTDSNILQPLFKYLFKNSL